MKILAQSSVPSTPSYLHLGYLAATTVDVSRPLGGVGVGLLVLGTLVLTRIRMTRTERGRRFFTIIRRPYRWAGVGTVLALGGVLVLVLGPSTKTVRFQYPGGVTMVRMSDLEGPIAVHEAVGTPTLESLEQMRTIWNLDAEAIRDGWSRVMRFEKILTDVGAKYVLISAGPDGRFGTDDDVRLPERG